MRKQLPRLIKPLLLMVLSLLLSVTACQNRITQQVSSLTEQSEVVSECRVIHHEFGEACILLKPERIVALDIPVILDSLLSLGIKPVGTAVDSHEGRRYFTTVVPERVAGIELVGTEETPSLEKMLTLKPDLILMPDYNTRFYEQLSTIAPTVIIDIFKGNNFAPIQETFRYIAQLTGAEKKAEEVLDQYQKRIEEFQKQLGDRLQGSEISVIGHYAGSFWLGPSSSAYFQVMKDIGLPIKPMLLKKDEWSTFSVEVIDQYEADILFIVEDADGSATYLSQEPLILSLEAVKNGQAYIVNRKIWDFYGPIGMNLLLDDLAKYLIEGKQDPHFQRS